MSSYSQGWLELPPPLRVNTVRPVTAATLFVAVGVLAALPFRRPAADAPAEPSAGGATGPPSAEIESLSIIRRGDWSAGPNFDPSLAWQPVPMTLPERTSPQLPPMPDSYYDLAFELEQPDPIRQRFSAAVKNRTESIEAARVSQPPLQTETAGRDPAEPPAAARLIPPMQQSQLAGKNGGVPMGVAEDLLKDRFVYTPIEPPKMSSADAEDAKKQRGTHAQNASMIRSGVTPLDDASRQRQFIREPQ